MAVALSLGTGVAALVGLNGFLRSALWNDERYHVPFAAIECTPPAGLAREEFLTQVRQRAGLPEQVNLLEPGVASRLADAFALHPWVAKVEQVEFTPAHAARVRLRYRRPVLAAWADGKMRAVDEDGVLLPPEAPTAGLPQFPGVAFPPTGAAGTRWGDAAVEVAARQQAKHAAPVAP